MEGALLNRGCGFLFGLRISCPIHARIASDIIFRAVVGAHGIGLLSELQSDGFATTQPRSQCHICPDP